MKHVFPVYPYALLASFLFAAASAPAQEEVAPYAVGDAMTAFELKDAHGDLRRLDDGVEMILFSRDMAGGGLLKEALHNAPEGLLDDLHAIYVADISGMPKLIAKMFGIPGLRKRPYPMLLDRDGTTSARLPDVEGEATIIIVDKLKITRVLHLTNAEDIQIELGLLARPDEPTEEEATKD